MRALREIQSQEPILLSVPTRIPCFENLPFEPDTYEASGVVTWSTDLLPIVEVGVNNSETKGL